MPIDNPFGGSVELPKVEESKEEQLSDQVPERDFSHIIRRRGKIVKTIISKAQTKAEVLKEYNYIESDIPVNHAYWKMRS